MRISNSFSEQEITVLQQIIRQLLRDKNYRVLMQAPGVPSLLKKCQAMEDRVKELQGAGGATLRAEGDAA